VVHDRYTSPSAAVGAVPAHEPREKSPGAPSRQCRLSRFQRFHGGFDSPKTNLRPNRTCRPVPLHLGQTWCA
jgi:hypothetical protein